MPDNPLLITDSNISGVLKNIYERFRVQLFPMLTPLLASIKKAKPGGPERMEWGGNGVFWDVVLTRPVGMTASDTGYFPRTAAAVEKQASLTVRRTYVNRQIDALAIQGTAAKEAAYVSLVKKIVEEAMDAATLGQQEILHGDGRAIKAVVASVTNTTTIVVNSPYGISGSGRGGLLLDVGMYIAVLDSAGSVQRGKATISAISHSGDNATLTLDTAITGMSATDIVVPATDNDHSYNQYPNGLLNLLNRGGGYATLHGLSASTYSRWDTVRMVAGTDTPSLNPNEMDIYDLILRVANRSGKNAQLSPDEFLLITTPGLAKKIGESFLGQRQWTMGEKTLKGGFKGIEVCGLAAVPDYWTPAGTIYLVHLPSLAWVDRQDWVKLSYEGAGPWRFIPGRDAYEVPFGAYWNVACLARNCHGMITGYTDTVRYDHVV